MGTPGKWARIAGLVLHILIGGLMIFAASGKVSGYAPKEVVENFQKFGLTDQMRLIGIGELLSGLLLIIPRTCSLGVLLTSSFWGGAICLHMSHGEPYVVQSVLLLLTWLGASQRYPTIFSSFLGSAKPIATDSTISPSV
jgi:hypothetical protein